MSDLGSDENLSNNTNILESEVSCSIDEAADKWGLDKILRETLRKQGITHFFPIQMSVVPDIIATMGHIHIQSRDICVGAPTGSGKTLVFVLGVVQALLRTRVRRLRALILLPNRDLAVQVHSVFTTYCENTKLKVGLSIGQSNFQEDQEAIVGSVAFCSNPIGAASAWMKSQKYSLGPASEYVGELCGTIPLTGCSKVDILVATPGRLLEHLESTPGFTLQHLTFLVVDEADKLFSQNYSNWIDTIMDVAYKQKSGTISQSSAISQLRIDSTTIRRHPMATEGNLHGPVATTLPLRKLLFSATLANDPEKLASLKLLNPIFYTSRENRLTKRKKSDSFDENAEISATSINQSTDKMTLESQEVGDGDGDFSLPSSLSEYQISCDLDKKPLVLLTLLKYGPPKDVPTIVFAASKDTTHRLFRLLELFGNLGNVAEISGLTNQDHRNAVIHKTLLGEIQVLVCSDGMARGMDVPGLGCVINYDTPKHKRAYLHRVGRTARAGRSGVAISILEIGQQQRRFEKMRKSISEFEVPKLPVKLKTELINRRYERCLTHLEEVMNKERQNRIKTWDMVGALSETGSSEGSLSDNSL